MADADINARALVEQLWQRAEGELLLQDPVIPDLPEFEAPEHNGDLRYLNSHWQIDPALEGPGGAEWKAKAKDRFAETVFSVLARYFEQERDFFAHGVRAHNAMAAWCGRLAREIRIVAQSVGDESRRLSERQDVLHRRLEDRIAALEARIAELEATTADS
jgi:hypothetical protein